MGIAVALLGLDAGLSIAVVRGRDTIVMKGYGKADLEAFKPIVERLVRSQGH